MKSMVKAAAVTGMLAAGALAQAPDSTNGWGYGLDSLARDLAAWKQSPHVRIDSIGASVQSRPIWMVSITEAGDSVGRGGDLPPRKRRVFMHARTHPSEVQAHHVANEAIKFLLADNDTAKALRRDFIFNFIPMYNPDGVALGKPRQNANGIDVESNWTANPMEPEPAALKKTFQAFMAGPTPIEVALNLHSDQFNCKRFFFFHYAEGTSAKYAELEKEFIGNVQARFPGGIQDWGFVKSWANGTVLHYPESYWWINHKEAVLALTYEDANCVGAGRFDSTGRALVLGSTDYLKARPAAGIFGRLLASGRLEFSAEGVRVPAGRTASAWEVLDPRGRRLAYGSLAAGETLLPWSAFPAAPMRMLRVARAGGPALGLILPPKP